MLHINGQRIVLRQIEKTDLATLYQWRNSERFMELCSTRRDTVTPEQFETEISKDLTRDRYLQCLILKKAASIGTIYAYNINKTDGHIFITTFITGAYERHGYGIDACALFINHLFETLGLYKIYMEVYSYNEHSLSIMKKLDLAKEGVFRGHRLKDGRRYDLIRFAIYQHHIIQFHKLLKI